MKIITASGEKTNKAATRRNKTIANDPQGVEIIEALHGAVQVDAYGKQNAVLLREANGKLNLEIVKLPLIANG